MTPGSERDGPSGERLGERALTELATQPANADRSLAKGARSPSAEPAGRHAMNEFHRRCIGTAFQHIDSTISRIEAILQSVGGKSPFSEYAFDVGPMEHAGVVGYLQRLRERMWSAMQRLEIPDDQRRISAAWAIKTALIDVSITLADIEPRRLVGYGALDEESATVISGILSDLDRLADSLDAYLTRIGGGNLAERMERLETAPSDREAIVAIDSVITRQGLVELRPSLDAILSRLESRDLEIAVFGRVSCGKSSLLNYLLGREVLPVDVLPVTAVLTRLRRTEKASAIVRTEVSEPRKIGLEQIAEYVTEERNPGNSRRVVDVTIGLPSARLSEGVTFIDTPGVGSLATIGAAQTKAYLPRCDVGLLLVDVGSTLDQEDLALLEAMSEAAIPSMVVVSKSDQLAAGDRERVLEYIRRVTRERFGQEVDVDVVSTREPEARLTDRWFEERIKPIMVDHQSQVERSIRRKLGCLIEAAASLLEVRLERLQRGSRDRIDAPTHASARRLLRDADDRIADVAAAITRPLENGIGEAIEDLIARSAKELVAARRNGQGGDGVLKRHATAVLAAEAEQARGRMEELRRFLAETAAGLSESLGIRPNEDVQDGFLAPMPPLDEARLVRLTGESSPRWLSIWPSYARRRIGRRLRLQFKSDLWSMVRDYRERLRGWTEQNLRRTTNAFEARIAIIRASLDAPGGEAGTEQDVAQLRSDLETLRRSFGGEPVAH